MVIERTLRESEALINKHSQTIDAVDKALKESAEYGEGLVFETKAKLATMLENVLDGMESWKALKEAQGMQVGDIARKLDYLNLVAAVMPTLVAEQVTSVQPLAQRAGIVFYMKNVYDSKRGTIARGDVISGYYKDGSGNLHTTAFPNPDAQIGYTKAEIKDETVVITVDGSNNKFVLDWKPVTPGSFSFVGAASAAVIDDGEGNLKKASATVGSIDYSTGAVSTTEAVTDSKVSYTQDLLTSPVDAPIIKTVIDEVPLYAQPRKLKTAFAFDAAYDLMKAHNIDINKLLQENAVNEIKAEIDGEILDDLGKSGTIMTSTFNQPVPFGISKAEHYDSFTVTVNEAANKIFEKTRRVYGNIIICGSNAANIIQAHTTKFKSKKNGAEVGPHIMGTYNDDYTVVRNPYYSANKYVVTYRGKNPFDTGYVYAPYMPITSTQFILGANFEGTQGFATSYAKKLVSSDFFVEGTITQIEEPQA